MKKEKNKKGNLFLVLHWKFRSTTAIDAHMHIRVCVYTNDAEFYIVELD